MNNKEIKRANESTGVWNRDRYGETEHAKQTEKTSGKSLEEMVDDLLRAVGFDMDSDDDGSFELSHEVEEKLEKVVEDRANKRYLEALKHNIETNNMFNEAIEKQLQGMKNEGEDTATAEAAIDTHMRYQKEQNDRLISELQLDERLASELKLGNVSEIQPKPRANIGQF